MIGRISAVILIFSTIFAVFSGRTDAILSSLLSGGFDALNFCFKICGSICFFSGLMNVAKKSGITEIFTYILRPVIRFLIPVTSKDKEIEQAVCLNIAFNVLGLGNAATPMGLTAVELMRKRNRLISPDRNVSMFVILNTVSVTIVPTTVISILSSAGASDPFYVLPYILAVQTVSCIVSILVGLCLFPNK